MDQRSPLVHALAQASHRPLGESEDRVWLRALDDAIVVVLADGAGGLAGGAAAAELFVAGVASAVEVCPERVTSPAALVELLRAIDREVAASSRAGETTGVVARIDARAIVGASCGDSEAWWIDAAGVDVLTSEQRRKERIGSGRARPVAFGRAAGRGTLLVASDGLFNYARLEALAAAARRTPLVAAADALIAAVRMPGGGLNDDVALALVRSG